jgi:addiction module RelE/StbE family toxin
MKIFLHKNFTKKYIKLNQKEKEKFKEKRNIFLQNPFHPTLNNHELHGKYKGYRSIKITADLRVIYEIIKKDVVLFLTIDSHSNLYS